MSTCTAEITLRGRHPRPHRSRRKRQRTGVGVQVVLSSRVRLKVSTWPYRAVAIELVAELDTFTCT